MQHLNSITSSSDDDNCRPTTAQHQLAGQALGVMDRDGRFFSGTAQQEPAPRHDLRVGVNDPSDSRYAAVHLMGLHVSSLPASPPGATTKEIANRLGVSEATVKFHVANAVRKRKRAAEPRL